ncbi:MAG: TspO/MBR family protein [Candidatus Krumholzibacteriia bacterium]
MTTKPWLGLAGWLLACYATAAVGSRFLPGAWYASLAKPAWTPPDAVFGPVWTLLYTLMAIAAWGVWRHAGWQAAGPALGLFVGQLVLSAAWSFLFFGRQRIGLALVDIGLLWLAILAVTVLFWRQVPWAAG